MDIFMLWVHLASVAVAVGGMFTLRFIGCPAIKKVFPDDENARRNLLQAIVGRFKMVVHSAIALLLISGGYLLWKAWPLMKKFEAYRHAMETKILLALVLFFISIMLTMTKPSPNYFQKNRDRWLAINFAIALIIIGISSYLGRTN